VFCIENKMPASLETLVDELQTAYADAGGGQPSNESHVRIKWRHVAEHIISGTREKDNPDYLAVELHHVFIGPGHRYEIMHRSENDPTVRGWRGVARRIIQSQKAAP
jgi:hypothetical protein